jgi:light-regulated signal transduction histidine kinase (bacteriophytochrome)
LENLLGNAWKFTARRADACIEVGMTLQDDRRVFFVRDNGAGFDPSGATKVFDAFQRLHSAQDFPGSGIGLTTVQRIIRNHGGDVWAEGQSGKGATFYFTLPGSPE